jgi:hypothetical protein
LDRDRGEESRECRRLLSIPRPRGGSGQPRSSPEVGQGGERFARGPHYCRANLAYRINKGHYGATSLDGAKFWLVNDLGGDFSKGHMDWNVLYFDKKLTPAQRAGVQEIVGHLFPVSWNSNTTAEADIGTWVYDDKSAHATMDGGKTAEVKLVRTAAANGPGPVVLKNVKYWGASHNDGFIMMPNEVEAYRVGPKKFEYKGTNGFLITVDISSQPQAGAPAAASR